MFLPMRVLVIFSLLVITFQLQSQVVISGIVKNYGDSVFYLKETGGFHNYTRYWRDNQVKIVIDKNRKFSAIIPESSINDWYISTGKSNQIFRLIKGEKLTLIADFSLEHPLRATGENAGNFNYSLFENEAAKKYKQQFGFYEKIKNNNIDSVLETRKAFSEYKVAKLNQYRRSHKMSDRYYRFLRSQYAYEPFERTLVENVKERFDLGQNDIAKILAKGINDEYAALHTTIYNDLVDFYVAFKNNRRKRKEYFTIQPLQICC
jgi:hypothetical protein